MGIQCNKNIDFKQVLKTKPRETGKGAGNGGVPVITNDNNWAVVNIDKKLVHKWGLLHESVHIVIISNDGKKILIQQRGKSKAQWKEYWDIIGEHMVFGDRTPDNAAENVFIVELGKELRNVIYKFDVEDELNYENKKDYERRHVYVIRTNDINESVIEAMNKEFEEIAEDKRETIACKWFDKKDFDLLLLKKEIVPYTYWEDCESFDDFLSFFKEKAKIYGAKNDLEDISR